MRSDSKRRLPPSTRAALSASIFAILLFQTCALFARSFTHLRLLDLGYGELFANQLSWLLVPLLFGALAFPILRANWAAIRARFALRQVTLRLVFVSISLGITLRLAGWGLIAFQTAFSSSYAANVGDAIGPLLGFSCPPPMTLSMTVLVSAMLIPLYEELVNRGFLLEILLKYGRWLAIVISAILFGIFHDPYSIPFATVIGVFFAFQYLNSRILWASVISHCTFNLATIVDWKCLQIIWYPVPPTSTILSTLGLALAATSFGLAAFLVQSQCYLRHQSAGVQHTPAPLTANQKHPRPVR